MRKCTARVWVLPVSRTANEPHKNGYWTDISGVFHQFGQQFEEFENGGCTYTTAIIEDMTGKIWEADVSSLKFLEVLPKFDKTYCSQCGREFGPGDHGYSHCIDHRHANIAEPLRGIINKISEGTA